VQSAVERTNSLQARCLLLNSRSIFNKVGELHAVIDQLQLDFIFITETWLHDCITNPMLIAANRFNVVRTDRLDRRGGGVCALVNKRFNMAPVQVADGVEIAAFDIFFPSTKYRFIVCYRPPYYDSTALTYLTAFIAVLESLCDINYNVFIVGDFNMPYICWSDLSCFGKQVNFSNIMLDFVCDHGLTQCVLEPTRNTNILDLVFTGDPLLVTECVVSPPFMDCDHMTVQFSLSLPAAAAGNVSPSAADNDDILCYYNYNAADYEGLNNYLSRVNWQDIFVSNADNINECLNAFSVVLNEAIDLFVPLKVFDANVPPQYKKNLPLFIRQLYRKKNASWRLYKQHKTESLLAKYKIACNKCKDAYAKFVYARENALIDKGNLGAFYRYVNSKLVFKSGIGVLKGNDGMFIYDDETKARLLNDFYSSVFTTDNNTLPQFSSRVNADLNHVDFSPSVIFKHLNSLKPKTSGGPDGLTALFLKNVAGTLAWPLSLLYSKSFELSTLPDIWKSAVVTPVFKKGSPSSVSNYRPISLTCIICKIMESIIKDSLISYLLENRLITKQQHGFLAKHSTCSQLLECVNDWSFELNCRHSVDVAYIDFQKAFDSVVHSKLCHKLSSYGITGNLHAWLANFLADRVQAVKINNKISHYVPVISGVPQGSVLGPVLFLLYINDLVDLFGRGLTTKLFADDAKIYSVIKDVDDSRMLQAGLDALHHWSNEWQLPISLQKCSVLHLGRNNLEHSYTIHGVSLPNVKQVTDLGVLMDSNIRFNKHYRLIVNKAHHRASLILKCFLSRDSKLLFRAFTVYIRPLLEYCSPVWAPVYKCDIELIERVQRRFTKKLRGFRDLTYSERLRLLDNADTLELRRLKLDLCMVFKIINNLVCIDFNEFFMLHNYTWTRGHNLKLVKPICNNNARQFSFACRCINAWNSLPTYVVNANSILCFKRMLSNINFSKFLLI